MNKDIRIAVGLTDHPKTVKLIRRSGEIAFRCLIRLWCYAAENKCSGDLSNMDEEDIAIASGWDGNPSEWVSSLIEVGFLDRDDSGFCLHDWCENNPYAAAADWRSDRARRAAEVKWEKARNAKKLNASNGFSELHHKDDEAEEDAKAMLDGCYKHKEAQQVADLSNAPSPSPSPSPSTISSLQSDSKGEAKKSERKGTRLPDDMELPAEWKTWAEDHGHIDPNREWKFFSNYWVGLSGARAVKVNWFRTWQTWVLRSVEQNPKNRKPDKATGVKFIAM